MSEIIQIPPEVVDMGYDLAEKLSLETANVGDGVSVLAIALAVVFATQEKNLDNMSAEEYLFNFTHVYMSIVPQVREEIASGGIKFYT